MVSRLREPSLIEFKKLRFLITDRPEENTMPAYIEMLKKHGVKHVVRIADPTYDAERMKQLGITVHEFQFPDGHPPPKEIVDKWLKLLAELFDPKEDDDAMGPVGIHCVAGLGRAPVMVAIALMENGMDPLDTVVFIRQRRRGALNQKQLEYVEHYKRRGKKGCIMM